MRITKEIYIEERNELIKWPYKFHCIFYGHINFFFGEGGGVTPEKKKPSRLT